MIQLRLDTVLCWPVCFWSTFGPKATMSRQLHAFRGRAALLCFIFFPQFLHVRESALHAKPSHENIIPWKRKGPSPANLFISLLGPAVLCQYVVFFVPVDDGPLFFVLFAASSL
ncbi:unnamed protein product [Mortierella alpina]